MKANPLPGEVWTVDLGFDGKVRNALVVSVPDRNCRLAISSVVQVRRRQEIKVARCRRDFAGRQGASDEHIRMDL
jgi:mRNA-degrading endonuclease toxin of MazEF toxin-antitoxin module